MFTSIRLVPLAAVMFAWSATAQVAGTEKLRIDFPPESPVAVVSMDWGSSKAEARGGAMVVELDTSLTLRNTGQRAIRGITLMVLAQEVTPGGKASVTVPSLNVAPGEVFPVRINLRLLRPLQRGNGALVTVSLDGILFDDLSFYGPNRLDSRRILTVFELEARRDREYFKRVLAERGPEGLQQEVLLSLARQSERPRIGIRVARRVTNLAGAQDYRIAALRIPGAPVEAVTGSSRMNTRMADAPRLVLRNLSDKKVRHVALGWIFKDMRGRTIEAGTVPAKVDLDPGATIEVRGDRALHFSQPLMVESMSGYIGYVEFADGEIWIPSREDLASLGLDRIVSPSPEEQRLTNLYRKRGLKALIEELNRF